MAATSFRVAIERVHRVSEEIGRLDPSDEDALLSSNRDSFVVQGGCPFRAFHRERFHDDNSGDSLNILFMDGFLPCSPHFQLLISAQYNYSLSEIYYYSR